MAMEQNEQEEFLSNVRKALGVNPIQKRDKPDIFKEFKDKNPDKTLETINNRTVDEKKALLEILIKEADSLNLNIIPIKDFKTAAKKIAALAEEKEPEWGEKKQIIAWKHPLVEKLDLNSILEVLKAPIPVCFTDLAHEKKIGRKQNDTIRMQMIHSYIGVTSADYCLAETATLVMKTRPGQARSVSLLPLIHIAVIRINQIIKNLKELYTILVYKQDEKEEGLTNCMTFISGPSKTADIEGVMVHGAHGPREVYIYVITDE